MGWPRKKKDPVSDRAQVLRSEIERLESQIQELAQAPVKTPAPAQPASGPSERPAQARPEPSAVPRHQPQPRLRSTTLPNGQTVSRAQAAPAAGPRQEQIFEKVDHQRLGAPAETANKALYNELGVRKYDLPGAWQRLYHYFQGSSQQHHTFVRLLAAGNIQGLRPLRYEKRVARRRFIILVLALFALLWGLIAMFLRR
jgi:hypothetical protein